MRLKNNGLVNLRGPLPQETASPRTYRSRLDLARPEPVQIVSASLHHDAPLGQERRPVVGPARWDP